MMQFRIAVVAAAVMAAAACTPGPLSSPKGAAARTPGGGQLDTDSPTGSVETTRRLLAGTWSLVSLQYAPTGGKLANIKATGTLTYDDFGNLTIDARTTDPNAPVAAREVNMMSFKGRAVIDTVKGELQMMAVTGNVNPDEVLSPEWRRRYEVTPSTLKLTSFNDKGDVTAVSTWHRAK
jgi:hypothetical protein